MPQPVLKLTGAASWGTASIRDCVPTGTAERNAAAKHSECLCLTRRFSSFPLPGDFERAGTVPFFKSHIPAKRSSLMNQFLKVFHFSSSSFHRLPPRKTKKGASYLENCSETLSRHLVHSGSSVFVIQCIHLDTTLFVETDLNFD